MTRKLLALATVLLVLAALVVASAYAGPSRETGARSEGGLRALSRSAVPFASGHAAAAMVKMERAPRSAQPEPAARVGKMGGDLAAKVSATAQEAQMFQVVVTTSVDPALMKEALAGIQVTHTYNKALYGFSARVTQEQLLALQAMSEVESIEADQEVHTMVDNASRWTGAAKAREDFSITGDGDGFEHRYTSRDVTVAVIDTGIDPSHKDLKGKVIGWKDFIGDQPEPYDDNGHGTHVAGTAAGAGVVNRNLRGVAPGAALIGVKVLSSEGAGSFSGVVAGVDWVVANKDRFNIRVLNLSLGSSTSSDGNDALSRAINGAVEAGIFTVVAAGNSGPDNYTIGSPAAADRALAVCAMRDVGESGWSLAPFSSRGPTADGRVKPDLCAPGVRIAAPQAGTTDRFVSYSGTSMAAPFVAGAAALLYEANPYLTVEEVRDILTATALDWGAPGKDHDYGYGRINVYRAIQRVLRLPGMGPANPRHATGKGKLPEGGEAWYEIEVRDTTRPIAATLMLTDTMTDYYDYDLFLFDSDGNELASSMDIGRQETIHYRPVKAGKYYLQLLAYEGSGPYALDVSWR